MNSTATNLNSTSPTVSNGGALDLIATIVHRIGAVAIVMAIASRNLFPAENISDGSGIYFFPAALLCGFCLIIERLAGIPSPPLWNWLIGWLMLVAGWILSASVAEYRYPAEIAVWEWIGVGMVCLYAVHWGALRGPKYIAILVVTLCLMQSTLAGYEIFVTIPQLRALYEKGDESLTKAMREIGVEKGGPAEQAFKNRLYSTEPLGTTGHPNSLAGLLVLGLPITLLLAWNSLIPKGPRVVGMILSLVTTAAIVVTLLLTKSRSAWIAAVVAVGLYLLMSGVSYVVWRKYRTVVGVVIALLILAVVGLVLGGILDPQVITQSSQSMQYRWEWWQASMPVIRHHWLLGVGSGNFRGHYLAHKLPFSSEEISDPHNFLIELSATGGLLTLIAYLALLFIGIRGATRSSHSTVPYPSRGLGIDGSWLVGVVLATIVVAVFDIGLVPLLASFDQYPQVIAFPFAAMLLAVIHGSGIEWNDLSLRKGTVAGVVGLHVHWLAAGGVAFPSLMMALWGLLGAASLPSTSKMRFSFWGHTAFVVVLAGITLGYAFTLLVPRIERDLAAEKARSIEEDLSRSQPRNPSAVTPQIWTRLVPLMEQWANACREAAEKVPGDRQGWERLAAAEMSRMRLAAQLRSKNEARSYRAAVKAWEQAIALDPRRSETHRQLGALYHEAAGSGLDADASKLAVEEYRRAVELYPNSALRRWELGNILSEQNDRAEALTEFKRALELDQTPHLDKRLTDIQRKVAEKYIAGKP